MKLSVGQLLGILVLIALIGVAGYLGTRMVKEKKGQEDRQAVFLTNGQVYFGKVVREGSKNIVMRDIYYLQVQQALQPPKDNNQQPQISLVKLGNELHGPKDEMRINRDHILFIEDMKDESKVNEAIANYIKTGGQPAPTQ